MLTGLFGQTGSLAFILKPGISMYLGIATGLVWLICIWSFMITYNAHSKTGSINPISLVISIVGLFGVGGLMVYGSKLTDIRGPLIYGAWTGITALIFTIVFLIGWAIKTLIQNGKKKVDEVDAVIESPQRTSELLQAQNRQLEQHVSQSLQRNNPQNMRQSVGLGNQQNMRQSGGLGRAPQQNQNSYGQQQQNPYGQQQQQYRPQQSQNSYGQQQQNLYGQQQYMPQQSQNPYQQQQNSYGQQQYRQPQNQNPYQQGYTNGQQQPYQQRGYGTGRIDETGHSKKSGFIGR